MVHWVGLSMSVVVLRLSPTQTEQSSPPRNKTEPRIKHGVWRNRFAESYGGWSETQISFSLIIMFVVKTAGA